MCSHSHAQLSAQNVRGLGVPARAAHPPQGPLGRPGPSAAERAVASQAESVGLKESRSGRSAQRRPITYTRTHAHTYAHTHTQARTHALTRIQTHTRATYTGACIQTHTRRTHVRAQHTHTSAYRPAVTISKRINKKASRAAILGKILKRLELKPG